MATEPSAGASAPQPAAAKPAAAAPKGINWGLPLYVLAFCFVFSIGIELLSDKMRDFDNVMNRVYKYGIPLAAFSLAFMFGKKKIDGGGKGGGSH